MTDNGWRTRDGSLADYFFGGVKGQMNCACKVDNSCYSGLNCNCNADDHVIREDEGFSTYKDDLPVTVFLNGDTGMTLQRIMLSLH
ncbi:hypothetical protein LOTGIDRAFT_147752 [Lottia gigantea]|uniref:Uncharacterized protein n=1 Tax=Lottia gigantea TaxID=225164 RepID=V3ZEF7_LOTGI|nr:hypothetical protein LOTGIDRAFT_147752 [Lottia gigantea]XP_009066860.1 hypothetical protein LOTGIDRAFT_146600 [Lottia gigantea]ESO82452.1 hypothetical protein LOTGIDRAFT_146600 [Lottia gigantea]ESO90577.1 hypothetical protein LOTGIDRAFT_147752 [Lottia gigantea]